MTKLQADPPASPWPNPQCASSPETSAGRSRVGKDPITRSAIRHPLSQHAVRHRVPSDYVLCRVLMPRPAVAVSHMTTPDGSRESTRPPTACA